jgi:DUF1680 family protein
MMRAEISPTAWRIALSLNPYWLVFTFGLLTACVSLDGGALRAADTTRPDLVSTAGSVNLAPYAKAFTSFVSGHESLDAINNGYNPKSAGDHSHDAYGNWPKTGTQWVEYRWNQPVSAHEVAVYWWQDGRGIKLPVSSRLLYWDGKIYAPVPGAGAIGIKGNQYNAATFPEVSTDRLRLEFTSDGTFSTGILQWKVIDSGKSPPFAPVVATPLDRVVVLPSSLLLHARVRGETSSVVWTKQSGPGDVQFQELPNGATSAEFSALGPYVLRLTAANGPVSASADLHVSVETAPTSHLEPVFTTRYSLQSPLWSDRTKQLIVHWIPHVIDELSKPDLKEGGIENFVQAGNRNAGRPFKPHVGAPWSDAYTHNAIESICYALELDPQGDAEIIAAQNMLRAKLDEWIPIILSAQEPDGYLQTRFTLGMNYEYPHRPPRWTLHGEHEGYTAGYFIEAAIADYLMTGGKDRRLYDAAKKLADCWDANIGPPPKKRWADGHEEIEQALVKLARLVDHVEAPGKGDRYIALAKFLLSCRGGGGEYDQNQAPVTQQYYAAGHAVRASYLYSAMTDIAMETGDSAYHSAVRSIWDDLVNRKYYVTGGIGSGETSEGFGPDFSLPNNAYCESCSGCGEIFFQHKMNMAYEDARYADLMEETLYNAVLSDIDLPGENFTYTNPLDSSASRYPWHTCPCCVGNIPRTLLMLPTWMYATGKSAAGGDDLYVNLFLGSKVNVDLAGTPLQIDQVTDYPQSGHVVLTVNPSASRRFALYVRVPDRGVSRLYQSTPQVDGITSIAVNGKAIEPVISKGYVRIDRDWAPGDTVQIELPMVVQRVHADPRVVADRGRVALRYGPLIYTMESVDQNLEGVLPDDAPLTAQWMPDLLRGVTAIRGTYADGSKLTAIPYYARNNRGGRSMVWIRDE